MAASKKALLTSACLAAISSFAAVTAVWVAWAYGTPGDSFANGSSLVLPSLIVGAIIAGASCWRARSKKWQASILVAGLFAVGYWALAPDGWWVTPPGGRNRKLEKESNQQPQQQRP